MSPGPPGPTGGGSPACSWAGPLCCGAEGRKQMSGWGPGPGKRGGRRSGRWKPRSGRARLEPPEPPRRVGGSTVTAVQGVGAGRSASGRDADAPAESPGPAEPGLGDGGAGPAGRASSGRRGEARRPQLPREVGEPQQTRVLRGTEAGLVPTVQTGRRRPAGTGAPQTRTAPGARERLPAHPPLAPQRLRRDHLFLTSRVVPSVR